MAFNQYWRYYGIPCWSNAASWSSSKTIDYQAGFEQSLALLSQCLSGATVISYQGGMYAELYASPVKAVIDDDVVGMVKRLMRGIDTSREGLSVELIQETGPIPGSFMDSDETLENWREECYVPSVASRTSYTEWKASGEKSILESAENRMKNLLEKHTVPSISPEQEQQLEDILQDARNWYRKTGRITEEEWKIYQEDLCSPDYPYA